MSHPRPHVPAVEPTYNPIRPLPDVQLLYKTTITNCPGMTMVALRVSFPPNGSTPPHTHAGAFLFAHVVSGYLFNKMNDDSMEVHGPGESFSEKPGCRHRINDNASATESAMIITTLIIATKVLEEIGIAGLVVIDEEYRAMVMEKEEEKI